MKKNKNIISFNKGDYLLGSFCLLGMLTAFFLFWKDLNISFAKANEPKIAVIYFKHNTAQRRLRDKNVWERLQQSSTIYDGDRIRTAADSEAYTIFNDGTRIDLHENTLIQVFDSKQGNNINFIDGAISVKSVSTKPAITIRTGGKAISLEENTSATLNTSVANQITAIVSTGAITVVDLQPIKPKVDIDLFSLINKQSPEQESLEKTNFQQPVNFIATTESQTKVTAGNIITFSVDSESSSEITSKASTTIDKPEVFLPTKTYSLMHDLNEVPFLPITWKSAVPMIMIFSRTSDFSEIIETQELPTNKTSLIFQLDFAKPEDTLYWQTVSSDNQKENSIEQYQSGVININLLQNNQLKNSVEQVFGVEQAEIIQKQITDADIQMNKLLREAQKQPELPKETNVISVETQQVISKTVEALEGLEQERTQPVVTEEILTSEAVPVVDDTSKTVEQVETQSLIAEAVTETVVVSEVPSPQVEETQPIVTETVSPLEEETEAVSVTQQENVPPEPEAIEEVVVPQAPTIVSITPVLVAPVKDKLFVEADFITDNPQIEFIWEEVTDAQTYTFILYNGNKELIKKEVESPTFILKDDDLTLLDNGVFKWCVTANQTINETDYNSILAESTFDVVLSSIGDIEIDRSTLLLNIH